MNGFLIAFAVSFWAWNLIAPLGVRYTDQLGLSSAQKSLLVAIPVLVGALGRTVVVEDAISGVQASPSPFSRVHSSAPPTTG